MAIYDVKLWKEKGLRSRTHCKLLLIHKGPPHAKAEN